MAIIAAEKEFNVLKIEYVTLDGQGQLVPLPAAVRCEPRPVVQIDPVGLADVSASGGNLTVHISGTVRDAVADIMKNGAGNIASVNVYANGAFVTAVSLTQVEEPATIVRPYAHKATFDTTIVFPADEGGNDVVVEAENAIGNTGRDYCTIEAAWDGPERFLVTVNVVVDQALAFGVADGITYYYGERDEIEQDPEFCELAEDQAANTSTFQGAYQGSQVQIIIKDFSGLAPGVMDTFTGTVRINAYGDQWGEFQNLPFEETTGDSKRFRASVSLGGTGGTVSVQGVTDEEGTDPGSFVPVLVRVDGLEVGDGLELNGQQGHVVEGFGYKLFGQSDQVVSIFFGRKAEQQRQEINFWDEETTVTVVRDGAKGPSKTCYDLRRTPRALLVGNVHNGKEIVVELVKVGSDFKFVDNDSFQMKPQTVAGKTPTACR